MIRVVIVDDHEVVRLGLAALLGTQPDMRVVGEAGSVADSIAQARQHAPDVVLMDLRLPDGSGLDACREILAATPEARVLFLTSYADDDAITATLLARAAGYLLKDVVPERLVDAIRAVAAGQSVVDPSISHAELQRLRALAEPNAGSAGEGLSAQERRVLALVVEGKTNKEIGASLDLSAKTVKNYLSNAFHKLRVSRRSQAAAIFSRGIR